MHSSEVHSNESACRKSGRLEMDQVKMDLGGKWGVEASVQKIVARHPFYNDKGEGSEECSGLYWVLTEAYLLP